MTSSITDWLQAIGAILALPISLLAIWMGRQNKEAIRVLQSYRSGDDFFAPASVGGRGGDGLYAGSGGSGGDVVSGLFPVSDLPPELKIHIGRGGRGGTAGEDGEDGGDTYIEGLPLRAKGGLGGRAGQIPEGSFEQLSLQSLTEATFCTNYTYHPVEGGLIISFGSEFPSLEPDSRPIGRVSASIMIPGILALQLRDHLSHLYPE